MSRRQGREIAMQGLFQVDLLNSTGTQEFDNILENLRQEFAVDNSTYEFAQKLFQGVIVNLTQIDEIIAKLAHEWKLERLARVDKAILRLGVYEMRKEDDTPDAVIINEAIELAKAYSTIEGSKFINGILGNYAKDKA